MAEIPAEVANTHTTPEPHEWVLETWWNFQNAHGTESPRFKISLNGLVLSLAKAEKKTEVPTRFSCQSQVHRATMRLSSHDDLSPGLSFLVSQSESKAVIDLNFTDSVSVAFISSPDFVSFLSSLDITDKLFLLSGRNGGEFSFMADNLVITTSG